MATDTLGFGSRQVQNEAFLASRRTSATIKARENALQDLDLAFNRYREVVQNLEEGMKVSLRFGSMKRVFNAETDDLACLRGQFYNDLLALLNGYKNECKEWVWSRRSDVG